MSHQLEFDDERKSAQDLFAECKENARDADPRKFKHLSSLLAEQLTFPKQIFKSNPQLDTPPSADDPAELEIKRAFYHASKYRKLLEALRDMGTEARWILLASWLRQEGICEPIEFLPSKLYRRFTQYKRKSIPISVTDLKHYSIVEAWKPYFERLLKDRRRLEKESHDPERDLKRAGYKPEAINAARNKRAAIAAACEWLAGEFKVEAATLRNAHCRILSGSKSQNP